MSSPEQARIPTRDLSVADVERVLRQVAQAPVPEGLEERVKSALLAKPKSGQVLPWRGALAMSRGAGLQQLLQGAAAAAIVTVVAGGSWSIYSRLQPAQIHGPELPRLAAPGGFAGASAMRTPQTLAVPQVHSGVAASSAPKSAVPRPVPAKKKRMPQPLRQKRNSAAAR